ncbi:MAG: dihydrodipicolinate reductase [Spirochaetaceae bacterium]|nr:dihydrodipicolinate reductase [Spirochaetaceae bacterium]
MQNIKIIIWGLGAMGAGMADLLLSKKGVEIAGVADNAENIGKSMYEFLSVERNGRPEIIIKNYDEVITEKAADVVLLCTGTCIENEYRKILYILSKKINVLTCAEEMVYPFAHNKEYADAIDKAARENGVSVLGTGVNPGFIMDYLAVLLTGCCYQVDTISVKRSGSLSPFGPTVLEARGIGETEEAFERGIKEGTLLGHTGFRESMNMIADAAGWELASITHSVEPVITRVERRAPYGRAKPGTVAGCTSKAQGYSDGKLKISFEYTGQINPEQTTVKTGDAITIRGTPNISFTNTPELPGGIATIALCVNMIPHIINATPGLRTMTELPVPHVMAGDMRDYVRENARVVQ